VAVPNQALPAVIGALVGMFPKKAGYFGFNSLSKQRSRAVAQNVGQSIGESPWLNHSKNVSVGHGVSLLRWRSGGVKHPHDTPPYPFMPSPTFANSSAALGDKGYDSKSNRDAARQRGICPAIPYRSNTKDMPAFFPKILYKARARIEQAVGKLKRFKRIALRCEKTAQNYGSFVALALGLILIKSVHTA